MSTGIYLYNKYAELFDKNCNFTITPVLVQLCNLYIHYDCFVIIPHTIQQIIEIHKTDAKLDIIIYDPHYNRLIDNKLLTTSNKCNTCILNPHTNNMSNDKLELIGKNMIATIHYVNNNTELIRKLRELAIIKLINFSNIDNSYIDKIFPNVMTISPKTLRILPKLDYEIENIRNACDIIDKALLFLWDNLKSKAINNLTTTDIYNRLSKHIKKYSESFAYPPIITQTSSIHPEHIDTKLDKKILVLIDIGCRYNGYCSDITRTFSITGYFNKVQKDVYTIVLNCFKYSCSLLRPGLSFSLLNTKAMKYLKTRLLRYNLITDVNNAEELTHLLMPHYIGHSVGLNVHDVQVDDWILRENDVLTIEPGLYFPEQLRGNPVFNIKLYNKIYKSVRCIRIEDTIKLQKMDINL